MWEIDYLQGLVCLHSHFTSFRALISLSNFQNSHFLTYVMLGNRVHVLLFYVIGAIEYYLLLLIGLVKIAV